MRAPSARALAGLALGLVLAPPPARGSDEVEWSLSAGPEIPPADNRVGIRLSGAGLVALPDLAAPWRLELGVRGSVAVHELVPTVGVTRPVHRWSRLVDVVPTARVTWAGGDRLAFYGEYGLGLFYVFYYDHFVEAPTDIFSFTVQLAGGARWALGPHLGLVGELRAAVYAKSGGNLFVAPMLGVEFH